MQLEVHSVRASASPSTIDQLVLTASDSACTALVAQDPHHPPRTHTSLGQPPSILTGRLPCTLSTRSHGVPHVPQRPSANDGVEDVTALTLVEHHGYSPRPFSTRPLMPLVVR